MMKRLGLAFLVGSWLLAAGSVEAAPIAHWGFDEAGGGTASDSIGSVDGTLNGGVSFTGSGGVVGGALEIDNGYVSMGDNFPPSSTFSIQAWIKLAAGDTSPRIAVSKHLSGTTAGYLLSINNIGDGHTLTNKAGFYSANGGYVTASGGPDVNDGLWHHLVGVYDNGTTHIYVDGDLGDSGSAGFSDIAVNFLIGGYTLGGTPVNSYQGWIDEVIVFDTALSAGDVETLYNSYAIPEPSTLMLLGLGVFGLAARRLRRRKA